VDGEIAIAIGRLDRYLFRVKRAIRIGDYAQGLADTAELSEIARRLWNHLAKPPREHRANTEFLR
jgi:hypothetical protein